MIGVKSIRVLVVDDSAVMRKMVERSIREAGIQIGELMEAGDGWEALALVKQKMPDLVLCDINMPTMDGIEFVRTLKSAGAAKEVPVVMITTEGSEARMAEAATAGACGYVRKPFTVEQIRSQLMPLVEAQ
jgi:two-component system, chemotaxis family, chemotaxis protein CheY